MAMMDEKSLSPLFPGGGLEEWVGVESCPTYPFFTMHHGSHYICVHVLT